MGPTCLQQRMVGISLVHNKSQQGHNSRDEAAAAIGGCPKSSGRHACGGPSCSLGTELKLLIPHWQTAAQLPTSPCLLRHASAPASAVVTRQSCQRGPLIASLPGRHMPEANWDSLMLVLSSLLAGGTHACVWMGLCLLQASAAMVLLQPHLHDPPV